MKDILAILAQRHYVANDQQIRTLAQAYCDAQERASQVNGTFLRVLIAGTQIAMGTQPRLRASRDKLPDFDVTEDLRTLNKVHLHYYEVILDAIVTDDIRDNPKLRQAEKSRRAMERNRRTNFARTAKATLVAYVRAGGNVRSLVVPTVTKASLRAFAEQARSKEVAKQEPKERVQTFVDRIMTRVEALRKDDEAIAADVAQLLILQLTDVAKCEKFTKSPKKAADEGIPLELEGRIWLPLPPAEPAQPAEVRH